MKFIDPSYEMYEQEPGLQGIFKQIERCGRNCYKSEDKITEDSAEGFVQRMIDSGHTAMLEHGTVYMYIKHNEQEGVDMGDPYDISWDVTFCRFGKHYTNFDTHETYFTTNLRWLVEKYPEDWKEIYEHYGCEPTEFHPRRRTVKATTSLHVYKDLTRHRSSSFAIESTRYCNYSKGKFGSELTYINPVWCGDEVGEFIADTEFLSCLRTIEKTYMSLIELGWKAQQAAEVLPQCTKADMIMTAFDEDWEHIFNLRAKGTTGKPHPEVERIMIPIMDEFIERGWIKDTEKTVNGEK